jgi:thiamine-monophosphate kinase
MVSGEFDWIERIVGRLGSSGSGIGDDAAVLTGPDGETWVWTIDTLVEHVHFRFDWLEPEAVGHRGLIASLSDLAAMGAEPVAALTALAAPADWLADRAERLYAGRLVAGRRGPADRYRARSVRGASADPG